jgi:hypothetical protein
MYEEKRRGEERRGREEKGEQTHTLSVLHFTLRDCAVQHHLSILLWQS